MIQSRTERVESGGSEHDRAGPVVGERPETASLARARGRTDGEHGGTGKADQQQRARASTGSTGLTVDDELESDQRDRH